MPKLTKRIIDAVEPQATEFFLWDEGIPGFGLRVMPSGRKSFVVQFRAGRRARRMSLGPSTVLTCDQATAMIQPPNAMPSETLQRFANWLNALIESILRSV
jgi:hypothetical protein